MGLGKNIKKEERSLDKLKEVVDSIYKVLKDTDNYIAIEYPVLSKNYQMKFLYFISGTRGYVSIFISFKAKYEISKTYSSMYTGIVRPKSGEVHDKGLLTMMIGN